MSTTSLIVYIVLLGIILFVGIKVIKKCSGRAISAT